MLRAGLPAATRDSFMSYLGHAAWFCISSDGSTTLSSARSRNYKITSSIPSTWNLCRTRLTPYGALLYIMGKPIQDITWLTHATISKAGCRTTMLTSRVLCTKTPSSSSPRTCCSTSGHEVHYVFAIYTLQRTQARAFVYSSHIHKTKQKRSFESPFSNSIGRSQRCRTVQAQFNSYKFLVSRHTHIDLILLHAILKHIKQRPRQHFQSTQRAAILDESNASTRP